MSGVCNVPVFRMCLPPFGHRTESAARLVKGRVVGVTSDAIRTAQAQEAQGE